MPILSPLESSALLAVLRNTEKDLEDIARDFRAAFPAQQQFRVCCSIAGLLEVGLLGKVGLELENPQVNACSATMTTVLLRLGSTTSTAAAAPGFMVYLMVLV
jgi:hypothetical protein